MNLTNNFLIPGDKVVVDDGISGKIYELLQIKNELNVLRFRSGSVISSIAKMATLLLLNKEKTEMLCIHINRVKKIDETGEMQTEHTMWR